MEKLPYYKCYKTKLKNLVKDTSTFNILNDVVIRNNKIVIHTYQYIKLYLIHVYDETKRLPVIDHDFVLNVMKTLSEKKDERGKPPKKTTMELRDKLERFYEKHYKPLMLDSNQRSTNMNTIFEYTTVSILTMIENNIKQHYVEYIERYVNANFQKKEFMEASHTKEEKNKFINSLRHIKHDLLNVENDLLISSQEYHKWIRKEKVLVLPSKRSYDKDSVYYDLQVHPQDYYPSMFYMMKKVEQQEKTIYNVCPLRSNIIPKHTKIDTTTLIHLLIDGKIHDHSKTFYLTSGNVVKHQKELWSMFFNTKDKMFKEKQNYIFNHMIETDGASVSVQFIRKDKFGKNHIRGKKYRQPETYIQDLTKKELDALKVKRVVGIDPNLSDLLFCASYNKEGNLETLRYTQNQRRKETKSKKYMKLNEALKQEKINDSTVKELETKLSVMSRKTLNFDKFKEYVKQKNFLNQQLFSFYERDIFRKLSLNGYINRQRTEDKFMNRFNKMFGAPEEVVVGIGDFEQYKHRKFKEPVKGKGLRNLFRKHGYDIYLVDEHKTSCQCHNCEKGRCETFRTCINPRPWKKTEIIKRHGLTMCQTCSSLWNRDVNASLNIYHIIDNTIINKERPKYLQRGKDIIQ